MHGTPGTGEDVCPVCRGGGTIIRVIGGAWTRGTSRANFVAKQRGMKVNE